ncbi:MAG TPA: hypothetical protein VNZ52_00140 [Candidatus Thermoplasmatota archaeon]|nr:hypothetical protein [Candidatus Thermoplasmatota archaeon]
MPSRADLASNPKGGAFNLTKERKRLLMMAFMGVAGFALLLALGGTLLAEDPTPWLVTALALLALALAAELVLLVWGDSREFDRNGEWYDWEKEANRAGARDVLLRCTGCNKTFPVKDTGERPLRTQCTHCGKSGVLKATAAPKR